MDTLALKTETANETPSAAVFEKLETSPKGLTAAEAHHVTEDLAGWLAEVVKTAS